MISLIVRTAIYNSRNFGLSIDQPLPALRWSRIYNSRNFGLSIDATQIFGIFLTYLQ